MTRRECVSLYKVTTSTSKCERVQYIATTLRLMGDNIREENR